jgi:Na+-driven multidrug efflux pump
VFVGHLNDPAKLAGVGLGNITINMFGMSIIIGMNSAVETFVS